MSQFEGKVVLVTGATSGIGKDAAIIFAQQGAQVVVTGRRQEEGEKTVQAIKAAGGKGLFVQMDVSDAASVKDGFAKVAQTFAQVNCLVANAGREHHTLPVTDLEVDEMNMIIDTNLKGSWLTMKYGLPLVKRPGGAVALISSLWGTLGGAGLSAYTAAKGGVNAMTRSLAVEQGTVGIRVNCISPGVIETPMLNRFTQGSDMSKFYHINVPLERSGQPEEVANAIVWICSDAASYITGQVLGVDGGITIKMPAAAP